jgi:hypothetical protein
MGRCALVLVNNLYSTNNDKISLPYFALLTTHLGEIALVSALLSRLYFQVLPRLVVGLRDALPSCRHHIQQTCT